MSAQRSAKGPSSTDSCPCPGGQQGAFKGLPHFWASLGYSAAVTTAELWILLPNEQIPRAQPESGHRVSPRPFSHSKSLCLAITHLLSNEQLPRAQARVRTPVHPLLHFPTVSHCAWPSLTCVTHLSLSHAHSCPSELTRNKAHMYSALTLCQELC